VLHQAGSCREKHVGRHGAHNDGFNIGWLDSAFGKRLASSLGRNVGCGYTFVNDVPLANAGALNDPLVGSLYHFFEILIGK
jgi:hypothetical protein